MKLLICRTIIIYLCVLFAMRLMGKRQLRAELPQPEILQLSFRQTKDGDLGRADRSESLADAAADHS